MIHRITARENLKGEIDSPDADLGFARGPMLLSLGTLLLVGVLLGGCSERVSPAASTTSIKSAPPAERNAVAKSDRPGGAQADSAANDPAPPSAGKQQVARDISFDSVKFDMQKEEPFQRSMITPGIEKLQNSKIRIRGYILPSFQQSGLAQFVLVRDNMQCCFGPGAALYDCIVVQMDPGKTTEFTTRPVAVDGVFTIHELRGPENKCLAIYHLQADKVQ
jgi:hypothetical protein